MPSYKVFVYYCRQIREHLSAKGVLIYSGDRVTIAGWPHSRISAVNDNEAKP